jgi:hypothetical protein
MGRSGKNAEEARKQAMDIIAKRQEMNQTPPNNSHILRALRAPNTAWMTSMSSHPV